MLNSMFSNPSCFTVAKFSVKLSLLKIPFDKLNCISQSPFEIIAVGAIFLIFFDVSKWDGGQGVFLYLGIIV
jgi:hypothetical protein